MEKLREQFEEYYKKLNPEMEQNELQFNTLYIYCRVQELWAYYLKGAKDNNIVNYSKVEAV